MKKQSAKAQENTSSFKGITAEVKLKSAKDECITCTHREHGNEELAQSSFNMSAKQAKEAIRASYPKASERATTRWNHMLYTFTDGSVEKVWKCSCCGRVVRAHHQ